MSEGVVLGSLNLRTRGLRCHDWSDLLAAPAKRGRDRVLPGVRGTVARPRVASVLTGILHVRINGRWTADTATAGADAAWRERALTVLDTVYDVLDGDDPLAVTVYRLGSLADLTGTLTVEDPGPPAFKSPHHVLLAVGFSVAAGRLDESGS